MCYQCLIGNGYSTTILTSSSEISQKFQADFKSYIATILTSSSEIPAIRSTYSEFAYATILTSSSEIENLASLMDLNKLLPTILTSSSEIIFASNRDRSRSSLPY